MTPNLKRKLKVIRGKMKKISVMQKEALQKSTIRIKGAVTQIRLTMILLGKKLESLLCL